MCADHTGTITWEEFLSSVVRHMFAGEDEADSGELKPQREPSGLFSSFLEESSPSDGAEICMLNPMRIRGLAQSDSKPPMAPK